MENKTKEREKTRFLSKLIEKETKGHASPTKWYAELYLPSFKTGIAVIAAFIAIFALVYLILIILSPYWEFIKTILEPINTEANSYQNIIAIHAGIGTVIFAMIIFVAESIRDQDSERPRVLLSESFLFPLTVAEIINFFIFLFFSTQLVVVFVLIIGVFTLIALGKVMRTQLNQFAYKQTKANVIIARVKHSIELAIKERIGKNLLFNRLSATDIKLDYSFFDSDDEENLFVIKSEQFGIVHDIDLIKLEEFARFLDIEAQNQGFSFAKTEGQDIQSTADTQTRESIPREMRLNTRRYVYKLYHDVVTEESNALLGFAKNLVTDPRKIEKLRKLGKSIFIVKQGDSFSQEIRHDLGGIKDQFSEAIQNRSIGKIDELADLYINAGQAFLDMLEIYDIAYTFDQAVKERHSFFARWDQLYWLTSDIYYLNRLAIDSKNIEVITKVIHIPLAISRRALESNDHYVFQEFIQFPELFYFSAIKLPDGDLRKFLLDRSWRYVKEISDFYVESRLSRQKLSEQELINLKNFAIYIIKRMQTLLKASFDANDLDSFNEFKNVGLTLFRGFIANRDQLDSSIIKMQLATPNLAEEQRRVLNESLKRALLRETVQAEIRGRKYQLFFGIASWILFKFSNDRINEKLRRFFESIRSVFAMEINEFTQVFLDSHSFESEDFWNWDRWETIPDGVVRSIDVFGKLEKFYVVQMLTLLTGRNEQQLNTLSLPFNPDFVSLIDGGRDLNNILGDISNNPDNWIFVLSTEAMSMVNILREKLQDVKQRHEQQQDEEIRSTPISQQKVADFKIKFLKEFYRTADLRSIFSYWKAVENIGRENDQIQFGISTVDQKAAFFDSWPAIFLDWGENYGRSLAGGEDEKILQEISRRCVLSEGRSLDEIVDDDGESGSLIIFVINSTFELGIRRSERFISEWRPEARKLKIKGFAGWYKSNNAEIPVFEIFVRETGSYLLGISSNRIGVVKQYAPPGIDQNPQLKVDIFSANVQSFAESPELLARFLDNPPDWLVQKGTRQVQDDYLRGRVLVDIFESFEYENNSEEIGFRINLMPLE